MASEPGQHSISREIYSVTRLNREVRAVLEGSFPPIWVQGEISNLARPASGHYYFSLKDRNSQVRCAMFKGRNRLLKFALENGMEVIARAGVSLYEGRGEFQLIIEHLEPAGAGALQQAFEQLKQRLADEGLFDDAHKKPLPAYPATIGIVTSPTGAAIRDIIQVLHRRYPLARVIVYPVPVQGEGAAQAIARCLELVDHRGEADVIILSRGGGSLEDLWAFNEEILARAVYHCATPVVCGVGHEIDFTIADFTADRRAPTPSAAAELVSPNQTELREGLMSLDTRLQTRIHTLLQQYSRDLHQLGKRLPHPTRHLQGISQRVDDLTMRMQQNEKTILAEKKSRLLAIMTRTAGQNPIQRLYLHRERCRHLGEQLQHATVSTLERAGSRLEQLGRALHTVSPLATLERGYAIVTRPDDDTIIRAASSLQEGESINTRLAGGRIHSTVNKIIPD